MFGLGWSEPAATNAPVQDEPVEAILRMNKNPILPAHMFFFSHLLSTPKFSHLLPTTYLPPPTYHLPPPPPPPSLTPSPELEPGVGAGDLWLELERDPRGTQVNTFFLFFIFFFFLQCKNAQKRRRRQLCYRRLLFVALHCCRRLLFFLFFAVQERAKKKAMVAMLPSPSCYYCL